MSGLQRLRKLERVVEQLEADAEAAGYRLKGEIEIAEEVVVYEIVAAACMHCALSAPSGAEYTRERPPLQTVQEAAESVLCKLKALQALTAETGQAWAARVERVLNSDGGMRSITGDRRERVLKRVEEVRAAVLEAGVCLLGAY